MSSSPLQVASSYPAVVGAVLARRREALGLDQRDLAQALSRDTAVSTWSRIESGKTALTVEQLALAAMVLKAAPSEILAEADSKMLELADRGVTTAWTRDGLSLLANAALPIAGASLLGVVGAIANSGKSELFSRLRKAVRETGNAAEADTRDKKK